MITIDLVIEGNRPVAALCGHRLTPEQREILYSLLPSDSLSRPDLAKRWEAAEALCPASWAAEQLHRVPMFMPPTVRISFL